MYVRPRELRVLHPDAYTFPSGETLRESAIRAAYLLPSRFAGGALRAHAFPVRPVDAHRWESLLVVEFPVALLRDGTPAVREVGLTVRSRGRVEHRFARKIEVASLWPDGAGHRIVSFVESVVLAEGKHEVVSVLHGPDRERPEAFELTVELPEIPPREAILPPPILGGETGDDVVVYAGGKPRRGPSRPASDRVADPEDFRPMLVNRLGDRAVSLAMTKACVPERPRALREDAALVRSLRAADGTTVGTLPEIPLVAAEEERGDFLCVGALDVVPTHSMRPAEYRFRAELVSKDGETAASTETPFERIEVKGDGP